VHGDLKFYCYSISWTVSLLHTYSHFCSNPI